MNAVEIHEAFRIFDSASTASVALKGLSLTVGEGEIVVVLGPSGSGKTTLLRAVGGFESLSAGSVRVLATDLSSLSPRRMDAFRATTLGFLDQHYARSLSPDLSCRHTVALQLSLLGEPFLEACKIADRFLDRVGLGDRGDDRPQDLSGGEQQRVAVCAAIAHAPRLLLVDEPAGELDAESAATIYALLGEIVREVGASALIVSHDRAATHIADRLVRIRDGQVVEQIMPGEQPALVVSRGGWVRLPSDAPAAADGLRLVSAEQRSGEIVLRAANHGAPRIAGPERPDTAKPNQAGERSPSAELEIVAELREVGKTYRTRGRERAVFSRMTLGFEKGRFIAVVGRSGTGKSTLLHLLGGLERPTAGDVVVLGQSLQSEDRTDLAATRRRSIALVTQEPGLIPHLSARENVELGLSLRGEEDSTSARAAAALESVGLAERLDQRAKSLSAGERERVAIARALATGVPLLLIDEPTARLDEENGRAVGELLARAVRERDVTVICATHDPVLIELADEVVDLESMSSRVAPLRRGADVLSRR